MKMRGEDVKGIVVSVDLAKTEITLTSGMAYAIPAKFISADLVGKVVALSTQSDGTEEEVTDLRLGQQQPLPEAILQRFPVRVREQLQAKALAGEQAICFGGPTNYTFSVQTKDGGVFKSLTLPHMTSVAPAMHEVRHAWNAAGGKMLHAGKHDLAFWRNFFDLLPA